MASETYNNSQELFQQVFSSGTLDAARLCAYLKQYLLEDPAETEFPMLQDILLDVPYAEQHVGVILHDADRANLITPDFLEFINTNYPKVREHMVEEIVNNPA